MSELYTSLTQLKVAMSGGQVPPMMVLTDTAKKYLDPAFTIGMGALQADPKTTALRCPMRGCGKYFHVLTKHVNRSHGPEINVYVLRECLGIPQTVRLISESARAVQQQAQRDRAAREPIRFACMSAKGMAALRDGRHIQRAADMRSRSCSMVGARNLRNSCEAQLAHQMIDLQNQLHKPVSIGDVEQALGRKVVGQLLRVYGSFSAAKASIGLMATPAHRGGGRSIAIGQVLETLRAWLAAHGRLPRYKETINPNRTPLIPSPNTIIRALGAQSWAAAMTAISVELGLDEGAVLAAVSGERPQ